MTTHTYLLRLCMTMILPFVIIQGFLVPEGIRTYIADHSPFFIVGRQMGLHMGLHAPLIRRTKPTCRHCTHRFRTTTGCNIIPYISITKNSSILSSSAGTFDEQPSNAVPTIATNVDGLGNGKPKIELLIQSFRPDVQ